MKRFILALTLLVIFASGAFATCSSDTDKFSTKGWCIDQYGTFTPKTIAATDNGSGAAATQGGLQLPIINVVTTQSTYDTLASYQSGSIIIDFGGVSAPSTAGYGTEYVLPAAAQGLVFKFILASNSTITIDTLTTSDTIYYASGTAGYGIKNSSKASGDTIFLVGSGTGKWAVENPVGTWVTTGKTRTY